MTENNALLPYAFRTNSGQRYIYDVLANRIIYFSPSEFDRYEEIMNTFCEQGFHLDHIKEKKIYSILRKYSDINNLLANHHDEGRLLYKFKESEITRVSQLVLRVTDYCNFSCLYCRYDKKDSDHYQDKPDVLSFDQATKALDIFFSILNSEERDTRYGQKIISFYGGEPLLEFDLLKRIIDHSRKYRSRDKIKYNLTTNASLLNERIIRYFAENKVSLLISLDGPEKEHNKCRLYKNNEGTYGRVWQNVNLIRKLNEKYFFKYVSYNAVYTDAHDLLAVKEYFDDSFFKKNTLIASQASDLEEGFLAKYNLPSFETTYNQLLNIYKNCLMKKRSISKYLNSLIGSVFNRIEGRNFSNWKSGLTNIFNCKNVCLPGSSRLYVSTDGNFHVCEKINMHFPIGDIYRGLDKKKIERMVNQFNKTVLCHCTSCQAMNLCTACYIPFCVKKKFVIGNTCEEIRRSIFRDIRDFTSIKEERPDAFKSRSA
ncbi:MAG: radical SAM protein [Thermoplasmata archaeon]|nr:radical SAM protein [Thermoplasmata archaeon]